MGVVVVLWPCHPSPAPPVVVVVVPLCGLIGASKGLVVPVFPMVSLSSFHPPTTPRAVAREAGGGWCVVGSPLSLSCIRGGHGGGGPPSRPGPEGVSWGRVGMSSMRHRPLVGVVVVPWLCRPPPAPPVVVVVIPSCGLIGASKGLVVPVFPVVSPSLFHPPTTP